MTGHERSTYNSIVSSRPPGPAAGSSAELFSRVAFRTIQFVESREKIKFETVLFSLGVPGHSAKATDTNLDHRLFYRTEEPGKAFERATRAVPAARVRVCA